MRRPALSEPIVSIDRSVILEGKAEELKDGIPLLSEQSAREGLMVGNISRDASVGVDLNRHRNRSFCRVADGAVGNGPVDELMDRGTVCAPRTDPYPSSYA